MSDKTVTSNYPLNTPGAEILVVDDNTNKLKLVRTLLAEQGYRVPVATDGK